MDIKDNLGRNFLHLTVQQPYGLKNLHPGFLQVIHICGFPLNELGSIEGKVISFIMIFISLRAESGI